LGNTLEEKWADRVFFSKTEEYGASRNVGKLVDKKGLHLEKLAYFEKNVPRRREGGVRFGILAIAMGPHNENKPSRKSITRKKTLPQEESGQAKLLRGGKKGKWKKIQKVDDNALEKDSKGWNSTAQGAWEHEKGIFSKRGEKRRLAGWVSQTG